MQTIKRNIVNNLTDIPLTLHFRQPFHLVHFSIPVPIWAFLVTDDMHIIWYIGASAGRCRMRSLSKQIAKQAALFSETWMTLNKKFSYLITFFKNFTYFKFRKMSKKMFETRNFISFLWNVKNEKSYNILEFIYKRIKKKIKKEI